MWPGSGGAYLAFVVGVFAVAVPYRYFEEAVGVAGRGMMDQLDGDEDRTQAIP